VKYIQERGFVYMKQNKYDDLGFFEKYSEMPRSMNGLQAAGEWPVLREMLPVLRDKRVLDLGCGYGWHCKYACDQQARSVVGVDLSEKMLAYAREHNNDSSIEYRKLAMEDISFTAGEFDVVISSLALHYVEEFELVCRKIHHCLVHGGNFILSVEHPIFTALAAQDWYIIVQRVSGYTGL
jgi:2-polyprenyl-3-methyl-5-hydroxy-6-metoxy-1,4-benzoquinol methylase